MSGKEKTLREVKEEIDRFRHEFADDPIGHMKSGNWFAKLLQRLLTEHAQKVNAEYFKKKYVGLDNERIAYRLINTASAYTGLTGSLAAAAVTAAELATFVTVGWSWAVVGGSLIGEIAFTSYIQLKLVYDISVVLDARLDKDDPEDILTIFWYALGVNIWEDITNTILKAGPRSATYLGRKALRAGIRDAIQRLMAKIGGQQLARKLTEKALLRLIVPGVNMPIAYFINRKFTKALGKHAITNLKHRGIAVRPIDRLMKHDRHFQLLALPTIFHIGISDEPKDISSQVIEMQNTVSRRLSLKDGEEKIIQDLLERNFNDFVKVTEDVDSQEAAKALLDIGICSYVLSKAEKKNLSKLNTLSSCLHVSFTQEDIERVSQELES